MFGLARFGRFGMFLFASLSIGAITGCATFNVSTSNYVKPRPNDVVHSADVSLPFDSAWDRLIAGITKDIYVINNIEKDSGLITVAFSSTDAEDWIDGGVITRKYGDRVFTFNGAADAKFAYDIKRDDPDAYVTTYYIARTVSLEGVANIHLIKVSDTLTSISVNARYVVKIENTGYYEVKNIVDVVKGRGNVTPNISTHAVSTSTPAVADQGFTLQSKGTFEHYIISLVAPHLFE